MNRRTYIIACLAFFAGLVILLFWATSAHASEPYPSVQVEYNSTECTYSNGTTADACSYPGTTYLASDYTSYALHYELGHQVDWMWLTNSQRSWLMHNWRIGKRSWNDSTSALDAGNEDGGEGIFPMVYAFCWNHKTDVGTWFQFTPNAIGAANYNPVAKPRANDCAAIRSWFG